jgi:hypothetical protein
MVGVPIPGRHKVLRRSTRRPQIPLNNRFAFRWLGNGKEMANTLITIDTRRINDWASFHAVFAEAFGFPDFYGRNMNAWVDCMTSLDAPEYGMTRIHADPGGVVTIQLDFAGDFAARCSEQYEALIDSAAFVNWRRIKVDESPVIALSFSRNEPEGTQDAQ